jgi:outer membrane protein TolC
MALSLPFGFNVASQVYDLMQAKAQKREAEQTLEAAIRQARSEVYGAFIDLEHDLQSYSLAVQKEGISQRTLELVGAQYREGTADAIRMNQAQTDFRDAQVARTLALHSIFTDRARYRRAVGEQLW